MTAAERYTSDPLLHGTPGWLLVVAGLAFVVGSGVWAFLPRGTDAAPDSK